MNVEQARKKVGLGYQIVDYMSFCEWIFRLFPDYDYSDSQCNKIASLAEWNIELDRDQRFVNPRQEGDSIKIDLVTIENHQVNTVTYTI